MVDEGKAISARRGESSLSSLYKEAARAAAVFVSRHGEQDLIDTLRGLEATGCADVTSTSSREVQRQR